MKPLINKCANVFGKLKPDCLNRLNAVLKNPTNETWDQAYTLIINGPGFFTLWQAVLAIDPSFQRSARDTEDLKIKWERVPDQFTLYRAIREAVSNHDHKEL